MFLALCSSYAALFVAVHQENDPLANIFGIFVITITILLLVLLVLSLPKFNK